jgi:copper(I)-binding protein
MKDFVKNNVVHRWLAVILLLVTTPAMAELEVRDAYVRGLPPGLTNTSVYMTMVNTGNQAQLLTGVSTPVAGEAQLHGTMDHGGMLHMMPLQSIEVPARGELRLESRGSHIMLLELRQDLVVGSSVELTLQFADGQAQTVTAQVRSVLDE